jgi:DNA-binding NarL/FixJ family response regulator
MPSFREGLKQLLSTVDGLTVGGEAADGEAVHRLLNESSAGKGGDPSELIAAIDAIRSGDAYVAEEVRFAVDQYGGPNETPEPTAAIISPVTLTRRERQILGMIPHGATGRDIAYRLGINPLTARKHREDLMRKLDLHSGAELTA